MKNRARVSAVVAVLARSFPVYVAVCVWVGVALSGCVSRSEGALGHASFSYESCLFGCSTSDNSMAAGGAQAAIQVQLTAGYTFTQVRSTNPSVATFSIGTALGGITIDAVAAAPGSTTLQLLDADGKLVDQTTITVESTAQLTVMKGWSGPSPLVLADSGQSFHVTTVDAHGRTTIGSGSVTFALAGSLSADSSLGLSGDAIAFHGAPGTGSVSATAGSASASLSVLVVPPTALTQLSPSVLANTVDSSGTYGNVDVVTLDAGTPVYGAQCNWTTSDSSVTVRSQLPASIEQAAKATTQFTLAQPGHFTATCTIGSLTATVQLSR